MGSLVRPGYVRYLWVCIGGLLIDASFELVQAYGSAALTICNIPWVERIKFKLACFPDDRLASLVHGEEKAKDALAAGLETTLGTQITQPSNGQTLVL